MPSVLTHDFFGRDAYAGAAQELGFTTTDEMDAFLLGNQGPDPLFYLVGNPLFDKGSHVGEIMHDEKPSELFLAFRTALDSMEGDAYVHARAYLAGFLCHYLLDRTAHPLIFAQEHALCDSGRGGLSRAYHSTVHANIEREIDEMMLYRKRSCTIAQYKPYEEVLNGGEEVLEAGDELYDRAIPQVFGHEIAPNAFSMAVHLFRIANRLFYSEKGRKRMLIGGIERIAKHVPFSFYCAMSHRAVPASVTRLDNHEHARWCNPFTPDTSTDSFLDLYDRAQDAVVESERALFAPEFSLAAAQALTHGINFSGKPVEV